MGNRNNREQWAGLERLRYIENAAYWRGVVNRSDVMEAFGISSAQSSGDFQSYHEINPQALQYNLNKKRYEAARNMKLVCGGVTLEEAMRLFLGESTGGLGRWRAVEENAAARVEVLTLPKRQADLEVERRVFIAVLEQMRMRVKYHSLHGSTAKSRWIRPHAFGHNGHRWHVRAWCEENSDYRDFVLARIAEAGWPEQPTLKSGFSEGLPQDDAWETYVTLRLVPSPGLNEEQQQAVKLEYAMTDGEMVIKCRKAMETYLRGLLQLPLPDEVVAVPRLAEKV